MASMRKTSGDLKKGILRGAINEKDSYREPMNRGDILSGIFL